MFTTLEYMSLIMSYHNGNNYPQTTIQGIFRQRTYAKDHSKLVCNSGGYLSNYSGLSGWSQILFRRKMANNVKNG